MSLFVNPLFEVGDVLYKKQGEYGVLKSARVLSVHADRKADEYKYLVDAVDNDDQSTVQLYRETLLNTVYAKDVPFFTLGRAYILKDIDNPIYDYKVVEIRTYANKKFAIAEQRKYLSGEEVKLSVLTERNFEEMIPA